jgi:CHAD domain-containing protein
VDLSSTTRADIGARKLHLALLGILEANEPGLRANLDTEFLHDFRVTVRRTRSLLGQIRHVFPADEVEHFSKEFAWIGRLTGPPRDMDVLFLSLREHAGECSEADIEALLAFLGEAQQQEHDRLVQALDTDRYRQLLTRWKAFLEGPPSGRSGRDAEERLAAVVKRRAWRLSRRIRRSARTIDGGTPAELLHQVRIDAKKLRYLVDVSPSFYKASDFACIVAALKKLQRVLGDFNDADVQERRLLECGHALGAAGGPAGALLLLGRLAEQRRHRRQLLREEVVEKLGGFRARETRAACRRAFTETKSAERAQ